MKMTPEDLATIRDAIAPLDRETIRNVYRSGRFPRADRVKDLDKRYRWDLFHTAMSAARICEFYDRGLTDIHIDTALRSVVRELAR